MEPSILSRPESEQRCRDAHHRRHRGIEMVDALLSEEDIKEALSRVYVMAVAAHAGYDTSKAEFDRDGVDLRIHAGGAMRPALDLQLKATVNLRRLNDGHHVSFPVKRRNYNLLCCDTQTPRLLVVLDLPSEQGRWMTLNPDELILRHRAYWLYLGGQEETAQTSVAVRIPTSNLFNPEGLTALMEQSRQGELW